jgi:hypothetical protein
MNEEKREPFWLLKHGMDIAKTLAELTERVDVLWRATDAEILQVYIWEARRVANRLARELGSMAYQNQGHPPWDPKPPQWPRPKLAKNEELAKNDD